MAFFAPTDLSDTVFVVVVVVVITVVLEIEFSLVPLQSNITEYWAQQCSDFTLECKSSCGHALWLGFTGHFMEDTPYLTHSSETWGVNCEGIGKCWSRYIGTTLLSVKPCIIHRPQENAEVMGAFKLKLTSAAPNPVPTRPDVPTSKGLLTLTLTIPMDLSWSKRI